MIFYGRTIALFLLLSSLLGCPELNAVRAGRLQQQPLVTLSSLRAWEDIGPFEQWYVLEIRVDNPNPAPLSIVGGEYRLLVNGQRFAWGSDGQALELGPYGHAAASIAVQSNAGVTLREMNRTAEEQQTGFRYVLEGEFRLGDRERGLPFRGEGALRLDPRTLEGRPFL